MPINPGFIPRFFNCLSPGPLYVATPSMDALPSHLLSHSNIQLKLGTRVARAALEAGHTSSDSSKWQLFGPAPAPAGTKPSEQHLGTFDGVIFADNLVARAGELGSWEGGMVVVRSHEL